MPERPPFEEKDVVWRFITPPMDEEKRISYNIAREYVIVAFPLAPWGVNVLGRFGADNVRETWHAPWHDMPVIAELLHQLKQSQARLAPLQAVYDRFCHLGPLFLDPSNEGVALKAAGELWRAIAEVLGSSEDHTDVTPDILESLSWMKDDMDERRKQGDTGLDSDPLSPQMQTVAAIMEDLRAGRIVCRRTS